MSTTYRSTSYFPPIVERCKQLANEIGFAKSCTDSFGRFLHSLAGQASGVLLELGTGAGVGTSWIASSMPEDAKLITVDIEPDQVERVRYVFDQQNMKNAEFVCGDWKETLTRGPYNFIYADVKGAKTDSAKEVFDALAVGGMLVMDDFTPEEYWPAEWIGKPDPVREFWLNHPKMAACEIRVSPREAAILATKLNN
jgi:predicted O-methyltransferase YrrM